MLQSNRWLSAILLSIGAHLLLLLFMAMAPHDLSLKQPAITEVEILAPPTESKPKERQVVRQALAPDQLQVLEDETLARFLSEKKQRVKQETQAALPGMTKNSSLGEKSNKPNNQNTAENSGKRDLAKEGFESWNPGGPALARRNGEGPSTTGESLPRDVSVGSFTALNTDRFTYYTFYARIEEMIRYRWESRVQNAINGLDRTTLMTVGERAWITSAEFLLNPQGHLVKVLVMKESGIKGFDASAVGAFREANIFPNPPQELVQEDGFIHLNYNFTVNYSPPAVVH